MAESELIFGEVKPYKYGKGESYMNEQQRVHFKNILQVWRSQLLETASNTLSHINSESTNLADQNDRASIEEEFSIELRTRDRESKLAQKIDKSIFEINKSSLSNYGYCNSCGGEIGIVRLEARPTADLCIDCKELDEMREKTHG